MNNFARFQKRNNVREKVTAHGNTEFIFKGNVAATITNGEVSLHAAVVNNQEKDSGYIYTHHNDTLSIGSVWECKSLHWLVLQEIISIKEVDWHKYQVQLCNFELDGIWGYFIGPGKKYININLKENAIWTSDNKAIAILPDGILELGDKIIIQDRPWLVQELDNITTNGISYYSLSPTTVSKDQLQSDKISVHDKTTYIANEASVEDNIIYVAHNLDIQIPTEDGYFKFSNATIQISKHTKDIVVFSLPFGVNSITITTKIANQLVTTQYVAKD